MKTILLIDSSGIRYFRRQRGQWQEAGKPDEREILLVIADLTEESLQSIALPVSFGPDRAHLMRRRLNQAFPNSRFRAAVPDGLFGKTALLTGFDTDDAIGSELERLANPVAGVWGMFMLLAAAMRRQRMENVMLVYPGRQHLRILVIRHGTPVVTRCIHRYNGSPAEEIRLTLLHLENHQTFGQEPAPPVLYLGDPEGMADVLPLPDAMKPKGDASYLHALFETASSSSMGQLAPMKFRSRYLGMRIKRAAVISAGTCLMAALLVSQRDMRDLSGMAARENLLQKEVQQEASRQGELARRIAKNGADPALIREIKEFASSGFDAAPAIDAVFNLVAGCIAGMREVRIKSLSYKLLKPNEGYCGKSLPPAGGRQLGLQFSILLTDRPPASRIAEIQKRISYNIRQNPSLRLIEDPASHPRAIQDGYRSASTTDPWCMIIPWAALRTSRP